MALPIIDISPYISKSSSREERAAVAESINRACTDVGFFYLTGHGIPSSTFQETLDIARQFFTEVSDEDKAKISIKGTDEGGDGARGWQKVGLNVTGGFADWHEALDLYAPVPQVGPPYTLTRGKNQWPSHPASFEDTISSYITTALSVGQAVLRAMSDSLSHGSSENLLGQFVNDPYWVTRVIGYPPLPADSPGVSCGEHSDYGCLTLLLADDTQGALQVRDKAGEWINADPIPNALVVNIGDMVEIWTNGVWKSTKHRVVHRGANFRVSVPVFLEPSFDALIQPLAFLDQTSDNNGIGDVNKSTLYEPVVYGDHLLRKVGGNFYGVNGAETE